MEYLKIRASADGTSSRYRCQALRFFEVEDASKQMRAWVVIIHEFLDSDDHPAHVAVSANRAQRADPGANIDIGI